MLGRDRCGEKPLYYGWAGKSFLFGSELKALRAHPGFCGQISRDSLAVYMRHSYVPAPYSIYTGICKLPPATILTIDQESYPASPNPISYWSAKNVAELGTKAPLNVNDDEAISELDSLLTDSIRLRMVADVPVGAFLSGGVDSSAIVAFMQKVSARPVKTFTIGFHEPGYDEARYAENVACHLGCEHTELYVTHSEAMRVIPDLPGLYDEPFADSSQIPTFLVSKLARRYVTVSLSGDGGDEIFGGYTRYQWADAIWNNMKWMPVRLRNSFASLIRSIPHRTWDVIFKQFAPLLPIRARLTKLADKLQKLAEILPSDTAEELYLNLVSNLNDPTAIVLRAFALPTMMTQPSQWASVPDFVRRMMFVDTVTYLPDDILVKLDRASMGVSLESRVPYLDHKIVEFSWRLPLRMKIRNGQSKWLLKQVLYQYVPPKLVNRPKSGFGVPIHEWLRGPLRNWAEELIDEGRLRNEGFFDPGLIRRKWDEHLSGKRNHMYPIWNVLMFQSWLAFQRA